ncbi:hypothetical protein ILYODFUR_005907 [Ilyodon furcidens]|uniref:Uncharacterized protein n=1 Tax=Ilyodon furcidens TaxID=33524 RepID=A0ABV0UDT3_9TELE
MTGVMIFKNSCHHGPEVAIKEMLCSINSELLAVNMRPYYVQRECPRYRDNGVRFLLCKCFSRLRCYPHLSDMTLRQCRSPMHEAATELESFFSDKLLHPTCTKKALS